MINTLTMNNVSIKAKIAALSAILITANIFVAAYALIKMANIGMEITAIAEEHIPMTSILSDITVKQLEQTISVERALRYGIVRNDDTAVNYYEHAIAAFRIHANVIAQQLTKGEQLATEAVQLAVSTDERDAYERVTVLLAKIEKEYRDYVTKVDGLINYLDEGNHQQAANLAGVLQSEEDKIHHALNSLLSDISTFTAASALRAEHDEQRAMSLLSIITLLSIGISSVFAYYIIINITRGINRAVNIAERIAEGDLTHDIRVDDGGEIGRLLGALQNMQTNLHQMMRDMSQSSTELAAASEQLATVSEQTNQNLHQQQREVEQVATAMNEMAATVNEVAQNAAASADAAQNANQEAIGGTDVVQKTMQSIEALAGGVEKACTVIQTLATDSESIGSVLDVIIGVAEQTNLLALNAAIEAARAGEQGRGFAVVADEVRTLARRTRQSTHEIEKMIEKLQTGAKNAVVAMNDSQDLAINCVDEAASAGASLAVITTAVGVISDMNVQIASAAEEQSCVAEEINNNITAVSSISEQNAAAANETTASSEELSRMAAHLQALVSRFTV